MTSARTSTGQLKTHIRFLRAAVLLSAADRGRLRLWSEGVTAHAARAQLDLVRAHVYGYPYGRRDSAKRATSVSMQRPGNALGATSVELPRAYDVVLVDQGYAGVYANTVAIWKHLAAQGHRVLLVAPKDPWYESPSASPSPNRHLFTLDRVDPAVVPRTFIAFATCVRSLLHQVRTRCLLVTHRSAALYLFDLMKVHPTVVYCDGVADSSFDEGLLLARSPIFTDERVLDEILFRLSTAPDDCFGHPDPLLGSPAGAVALHHTYHRARENWVWAASQLDTMRAMYPDQGTLRLVLPFVPTASDPMPMNKRRREVLFTTSMHNIHAKGLPELVAAMGAMRNVDVGLRCVVRQREFLPPQIATLGDRVKVESLTHQEMERTYSSCAVNCRVSREESSPVSIIESMAAGMAVITSPVVARNISFLRDGVNALISDPDDIAGLTRRLDYLFENPEAAGRLGEAAVAAIRTNVVGSLDRALLPLIGGGT